MHRLRGIHREAPGVLAEGGLDGGRLVGVAERRGRAVGVQVLDLVAVDAAVSQRRQHRAARAVHVRRGDVVGIGAHAHPGQLAVDPGAALPGVLVLLQDQDAGALAEDETIAIAVERARGRGRIVVSLGERLQGAKPPHAGHADRRFRPACDHDVGIAILDEAPARRPRNASSSCTPTPSTRWAPWRRTGSRSVPRPC